MTNRKLALTISVLTVLASGCSTPVNKPGSPPVTPVSEPSHTLGQFQWSPVIIPYSSQYRVNDSSTVSIANDSTGKEVLLVSSGVYSLVLTEGENSTIDLHIDSVNTDTAHSQTPLELHATATLSLHGQISDLRSITSTSCKNGMDPKLAHLFDLIIPFSQSPVIVGSHWADTSSIITCHGKIALKQRVIRDYTLLTELSRQNTPTIQLKQTTEAEIDGVPTDSTNSITATGSGSGTAILLLDQNTGELLESVGTLDLSLSIITNRGKFPFRQHSKLKIHID